MEQKASLTVKSSIALAILLLVSSCTLFNTREPEEPEVSDWTFEPPTSSDIVVDNFINCINHKSVDHYLECFAGENYLFTPSSDAMAMFPSFFDNWNIDDERQFFLSLTTTLGQSNSINIELLNKNNETMTADSVILSATYNLNMDLPNGNYPTEYTGKLLFTLIPATNGLWSISRWQDFQVDNQGTTKETFSFLKAHFHN